MTLYCFRCAKMHCLDILCLLRHCRMWSRFRRDDPQKLSPSLSFFCYRWLGSCYWWLGSCYWSFCVVIRCPLIVYFKFCNVYAYTTTAGNFCLVINDSVCLCIIFIYTYNECQVCCGLHHFHLMVCSHFWCAGDYISLQHQYEVDMASAPHRGDTLFWCL